MSFRQKISIPRVLLIKNGMKLLLCKNPSFLTIKWCQAEPSEHQLGYHSCKKASFVFGQTNWKNKNIILFDQRKRRTTHLVCLLFLFSDYLGFLWTLSSLKRISWAKKAQRRAPKERFAFSSTTSPWSKRKQKQKKLKESF